MWTEYHPRIFHNRSTWVRKIYLNESVKFWSILFNSLSCCRNNSILLIECKTVVWCLFPNSRPMCGSDIPVSLLQRYVVRDGNVLAFGFLLDDSDLGFEIGRLNVGNQAPLEPRMQPLFQCGYLPWRTISRDDDLFLCVVE